MRRALRWLALILLGVTLWQLGQGAYIYAKAGLAQVLLQRAWDRTLAGERQARPWAWADTWPVARLRMPARGVDLIVLDGVSGRTLAFGPGHVPGTARPGRPGNTVLAGHRDTHFRFLAELRRGEELVLDLPGGGRRRYRVTGGEVVDERAVELLADTEAALLTLVTCYPFDAVLPGGPLRYVVTAPRI